MLPMPIRVWPWISIRDSMPTGMSQRVLSRVSTFCGVCTNKLYRCFDSRIGGFGLCRCPTFHGGLIFEPIFRSCLLRSCNVCDIAFGGTDLAKHLNACMHIRGHFFVVIVTNKEFHCPGYRPRTCSGYNVLSCA